MNATQWRFVRNWLIVLGCIAFLAFMIVGIAYEWGIVYLICILMFVAMIGYCVIYLISELVYRWRVMGVTEESEMDLFDRYWHFTIRDGYTSCKLHDIETGEVGEDWREDYRKWVYDYLMKVNAVKRPKIMK